MVQHRVFSSHFENGYRYVRFWFSENVRRKINEVIHEEDYQLFPVPWGIHNLFQKTEKQLSALYLRKLLIHLSIPSVQLDLIWVTSYCGCFSLCKWRLLDHLTCWILVSWQFIVYFNNSIKLSSIAPWPFFEEHLQEWINSTKKVCDNGTCGEYYRVKQQEILLFHIPVAYPSSTQLKWGHAICWPAGIPTSSFF